MNTQLTSWDQVDNIGDYLGMFGNDLIRRLNEEYIPVHHPVNDPYLPILDEIQRPLFAAQAHVVTALYKGFQKSRRLLVCGEMGTGKTSVSIGVFYAAIQTMLQGVGRVLYMVPNHLVKKTKREIQMLLKDKCQVTFLNNYKDVLNLKDSGVFKQKPRKIEVYIIARDTAKLGFTYELAAKRVQRTYKKKVERKGAEDTFYPTTAFSGWVCPECGGQLMKEVDDSLLPMEDEDFFDKHGKPVRRTYNLKCTNKIKKVSAVHYEVDPDGRKMKRVEFKEKLCGSPLWQAKNRDKRNISGELVGATGGAPRRVSPADLMKRYFKRSFDLCIGDECHELAGGSAQAHAFHVFMNCAKYSLAMTGTLSNGYASSLFELFFRMFPQRMIENGFRWGEVSKWIDLYGVRERTVKIKKDNTLNSSSNGTTKRVSVKELASIGPQLFTDFLSDVACFIQMGDIFEVLPELKEGPVNVSMEGSRTFMNGKARIERKAGKKKRKICKSMRLVAPPWYLEANLNMVENLLRQQIDKDLRATGQSLLLGSLVNTLLSYPDLPFNFNGIYHPDTGDCIVPDHYRLSDRVIYPKEQQLLKFVKGQLKLGRKVCIFSVFTGKGGTHERLEMLLQERGIKTAILRSTVPGKEREEWIAAREREGVQVLLTHPKLVSTGLDLLGFPTLYFYQTGYKVNDIRQASRRHFRIGQKNLCLTLYSAYKNTMQELALNLMAAKMSTAMALEGKFSQDGLSALTSSAGGGSIAAELAKRFVGNQVEGVESAESIWGTMTIDAEALAPAAPIELPAAQAAEEYDIFSMISEIKKPAEKAAVLLTEVEVTPKPARREMVMQHAEEGQRVVRKKDWIAEFQETTFTSYFHSTLDLTTPITTAQEVATTEDQNPIVRYTTATLREALLLWAADHIPQDTLNRFQEQIHFVEEQVSQGVVGFTLQQYDGNCALIWHAEQVSSDEVQFRRWLYQLTCKPVPSQKVDLSVSGSKSSTVKSKQNVRKTYRVSTDQIAMDF
ncbi:DEAD/DEAH box helicase [Paenibacillus enshidis]|uniref:DEAD/DEAH box helicase n=1 Tax=Paenibacillus enshidis TaxID=1458439 RepID=A0ABV5AVI1_9BACL